MSEAAPFSGEELRRYARHLVLPEIGGAGQQALKRARVLLVGLGGIGSPALLYLAAAGVGRIGLLDDDRVSLSNLQRQVAHGTGDVGRPKVESAADAARRLNPHSETVLHDARLEAANGAALVEAYDLVLDGSDSFVTRALVAEFCEALRRPLVSAAVGRFSGQLTVFKPWEPDGAAGRLRPRWRDLHPAAPPEGLLPACAEAGILGATTGVLGTLAAAEAVKLLSGAGEPLLGRLLLVDLLLMRFDEIRYRRRD